MYGISIYAANTLRSLFGIDFGTRASQTMLADANVSGIICGRESLKEKTPNVFVDYLASYFHTWLGIAFKCLLSS